MSCLVFDACTKSPESEAICWQFLMPLVTTARDCACWFLLRAASIPSPDCAWWFLIRAATIPGPEISFWDASQLLQNVTNMHMVQSVFLLLFVFARFEHIYLFWIPPFFRQNKKLAVFPCVLFGFWMSKTCSFFLVFILGFWMFVNLCWNYSWNYIAYCMLLILPVLTVMFCTCFFTSFWNKSCKTASHSCQSDQLSCVSFTETWNICIF